MVATSTWHSSAGRKPPPGSPLMKFRSYASPSLRGHHISVLIPLVHGLDSGAAGTGDLRAGRASVGTTTMHIVCIIGSCHASRTSQGMHSLVWATSRRRGHHSRTQLYLSSAPVLPAGPPGE